MRDRITLYTLGPFVLIAGIIVGSIIRQFLSW